MKIPLDGKCSEDVVVDEGRTQVGEDAGRVFFRVFIQVASDHIIEDGIAKKFESVRGKAAGSDRKSGML